MISLKNITKRYGALTVYENFDLDIEEGTITCVLGSSGCGKTTLLNILSGLTSFRGEVHPKKKCAYIFQQPRLVPNLTVKGNLKLVCRDEKKISEILSRLELSEKADSYPIELSGGQAQRVSVARAFLYEADLLLMDEPFSSLDTALKIRLTDVFCSLWKEEKRTVVFVTHDAEEAYMIAHRALVLKEGKVVADIKDDSPVPRAYGENSAFRREIVKAILS